MNEYLQVGTITSTHGLHGEVKVFPTTDDPRRYDDLTRVWIEGGGDKKPLDVEKVRYFKQFVIVKFRELDSIESVRGLVKKNLYVTRDQAVKLEENEYFIADLIGLDVYEENGEKLGRLTDVISTGANDVYVVTGEDREILVPAIRQCILEVNLQAGRMTVHLLAGL